MQTWCSKHWDSLICLPDCLCLRALATLSSPAQTPWFARIFWSGTNFTPAFGARRASAHPVLCVSPLRPRAYVIIGSKTWGGGSRRPSRLGARRALSRTDGTEDGTGSQISRTSAVYSSAYNFLLPPLLSIVLHCSYLTHLTFNYLSYLKKNY